MSFGAFLHTAGEACDKCKKPMTADKPGIDLRSSCPEARNQTIWIHLSCLSRAVRKIEAQFDGPR